MAQILAHMQVSVNAHWMSAGQGGAPRGGAVGIRRGTRGSPDKGHLGER